MARPLEDFGYTLRPISLRALGIHRGSVGKEAFDEYQEIAQESGSSRIDTLDEAEEIYFLLLQEQEALAKKLRETVIARLSVNPLQRGRQVVLKTTPDDGYFRIISHDNHQLQVSTLFGDFTDYSLTTTWRRERAMDGHAIWETGFELSIVLLVARNADTIDADLFIVGAEACAPDLERRHLFWIETTTGTAADGGEAVADGATPGELSLHLLSGLELVQSVGRTSDGALQFAHRVCETKALINTVNRYSLTCSDRAWIPPVEITPQLFSEIGSYRLPAMSR
ncbi:MAG: hypothetical protein HYV02_08915 [Deltaproteobacteria bacterium]|nr:hypothetical protein [Deltaproteobacteria bacterium]